MAEGTRADQVGKYAKAILGGARGGEEGVMDDLTPGSPALEARIEGIMRWTKQPGERRGEIAATFEQIHRKQPLNAKDLGLLEAIILPTERPVSDIKQGRIVALPDGEFQDLLRDASKRDRLEKALASVGCIQLPTSPQIPYLGTGFVVGPGLVMTNRHVARRFADGVGRKRLSFVPGQSAAFNPLREEENAANEATYQVRSVKMIHPYWDMALLEIPDLPAAPLRLASVDPSGPRRMVVVVGYPGFDPRNPTEIQNNVFHGHYYVKRLSPGYLTGVDRCESFGKMVDAATHDASTLAGNSGSAVIDVKTGDVVALHFAGEYMDTNFAVPVFELARDPRVIDMGVGFTSPAPAPSLPSAPFWDEVDLESVALSTLQTPGEGAQLVGGVASMRFTVPIEISLNVRVGQITPGKDRG